MSYINTLKISVIKRNGQLVPYDSNKIEIAIAKAIASVGGREAMSSSTSIKAQKAAKTITENIIRTIPEGQSLHIETIQDKVELYLMRREMPEVAKAYVLYRDKQAKKRQKLAAENADIPSWDMKLADGSIQKIDLHYITQILAEACDGLEDISLEVLVDEASRSMFNKMNKADIYDSLILTARAKLDLDHSYTYVAARLLTMQSYKKVADTLNLNYELDNNKDQLLKAIFKSGINLGIEIDLINKNLKKVRFRCFSK